MDYWLNKWEDENLKIKVPDFYPVLPVLFIAFVLLALDAVIEVTQAIQHRFITKGLRTQVLGKLLLFSRLL